MDSEQDESIYRLAVECEKLFNQRIDEQQLQESSPYGIGISSLLTELRGRFLTWAAHLGVFAKKSLCLDRRLSNLPDLQDLVVRLLDTLRRMLAQFVAGSGNVTNGEPTSFQEEEGGNDPLSPHIEVLEIIEEALSRLNRLGNAIRQASAGGLVSRAKRFAEGLDLTPFEILSHSSVRGLYPGANQSLQIHLSQSMTNCYKKILLLRSRHKSLEARRPKPHPQLFPIREEQDITNKPSTSIVAGMSQPQTASLGSPKQLLPRQFVLQSELSSMDTRILRARLRDSQAAASRKYRTSSIQINLVDYPPAPQAADESNMVTCDWCFETHPKDDMEGSNWKRHLNNDFEPYICIAEQCVESCPRYQRFEDWFEHMETQHGPRWHQEIYKQPSWICPLCEGDYEEYTNPQGLLSHIEDKHSQSFTPEQVQMMMRQSQTHVPRPLEECPLCCYDIPAENGKNRARDVRIRRQSIPAKRHKEPLQRQPSKSARNTAEYSHSVPDQPLDSTSNNSDIESEQTGSLDIPQKPEFAEVVARHVASHLQTLMCVTIRMINLQLNADETLSDVEGDSIDVDNGSDSLWRSNNKKMTHIEETSTMDFSDSTESHIVLEEEHPLASNPFFTNSNHGWDEVELSGAIPVEKDTFLQNLLTSGAYQSHLDDNNLDIDPPSHMGRRVTLGFKIRQSMVESTFSNRKTMFLPEGAVDSLVTRNFIIWAFYKSKNYPSLTPSLRSVIGFILTKAKKIFVIFVLIGLKGAALYRLTAFLLERGIYDDRLPFDDSTLNEFHPSLKFEDDTKGMCLDQEDSEDETWTEDHISEFLDKQWRFCSPTFSTYKENHDIDIQAILPFTEKHVGSAAAGAFGEVMKYKIHQSHLDTGGLIFPCTEFVAVKKVKLEGNQDRQIKITGWEKEVRASWKMRALREKHIVNFITAFRFGPDEHYLILEWADGGNLRTLWKSFTQPLTAELVRDAFEQLFGLSRALFKVHNPVDENKTDQHFRHGDLKPENILWFKHGSDSTRLGTLKIGDWGLAKQHSDVTQLRTIQTSTGFGTRRYEPPEERSVHENSLIVPTKTGKVARKRSRLYDLWAMGCIWLEFLIWLMYGYEGLEAFNRSFYGGQAENPSYYEIDTNGVPKVHRVALQWLEHMARDPVCQVEQTALGNLLETIRDRLLVVKLPQNFGSTRDMSKTPQGRLRSSSDSNSSNAIAPPKGLAPAPSISKVAINEPSQNQGSTDQSPAISVTVSQSSPPFGGPNYSDKDCRARAEDLYNRMIEIMTDEDNANYWLSGTPLPPPDVAILSTEVQHSGGLQAGLSVSQGLNLALTG